MTKSPNFVLFVSHVVKNYFPLDGSLGFLPLDLTQ